MSLFCDNPQAINTSGILDFKLNIFNCKSLPEKICEKPASCLMEDKDDKLIGSDQDKNTVFIEMEPQEIVNPNVETNETVMDFTCAVTNIPSNSEINDVLNSPQTSIVKQHNISSGEIDVEDIDMHLNQLNVINSGEGKLSTSLKSHCNSSTEVKEVSSHQNTQTMENSNSDGRYSGSNFNPGTESGEIEMERACALSDLPCPSNESVVPAASKRDCSLEPLGERNKFPINYKEELHESSGLTLTDPNVTNKINESIITDEIILQNKKIVEDNLESDSCTKVIDSLKALDEDEAQFRENKEEISSDDAEGTTKEETAKGIEEGLDGSENNGGLEHHEGKLENLQTLNIFKEESKIFSKSKIDEIVDKQNEISAQNLKLENLEIMEDMEIDKNVSVRESFDVSKTVEPPSGDEPVSHLINVSGTLSKVEDNDIDQFREKKEEIVSDDAEGTKENERAKVIEGGLDARNNESECHEGKLVDLQPCNDSNEASQNLEIKVGETVDKPNEIRDQNIMLEKFEILEEMEVDKNVRVRESFDVSKTVESSSGDEPVSHLINVSAALCKVKDSYHNEVSKLDWSGFVCNKQDTRPNDSNNVKDSKSVDGDNIESNCESKVIDDNLISMKPCSDTEEFLDDIDLELVENEMSFTETHSSNKPLEVTSNNIDSPKIEGNSVLKNFSFSASLQASSESIDSKENIKNSSPNRKHKLDNVNAVPEVEVKKIRLDEQLGGGNGSIQNIQCNQIFNNEFERSRLGNTMESNNTRMESSAIMESSTMMMETSIRMERLCNSENLNCNLCQRYLRSKMISSFEIEKLSEYTLFLKLGLSPFQLILNLASEDNHQIICGAVWKPQLDDLKMAEAKLAVKTFKSCLNHHVEKLVGSSLCSATNLLANVIDTYEAMMSFLKEIHAIKSTFVTSCHENGLNVTVTNAGAHLMIDLCVTVKEKVSNWICRPTILIEPDIKIGNIRKSTIEEAIAAVDGKLKLLNKVKAVDFLASSMTR